MKIYNIIKKSILWILFIISFLLYLENAGILLFLLNSLSNGRILFSASFWTFAAIIVALFGKSIIDWLNQPIILVDFDPNSDRCFRNAILEKDVIQDFGQFANVTRQYFRLKICNTGKDVARKVRVTVDLYYDNWKEAERFEPNCLRWLTQDKETDIASGEVTYINLLSQVIKISDSSIGTYPRNFFVLRWELYNYMPRGIAWDRESRIFNIKLVVHGDNIKAKTYWFRFIPDSDNIFNIGKLVKINSIF